MSDWITTAHYANEHQLSTSQARMQLEWLVAQGRADRAQSRKTITHWKIGNGATGKRGKGELDRPSAQAEPRIPDNLLQTLAVLVNGGTMSAMDVQEKIGGSHQTARNYLRKLVSLGLAFEVPQSRNHMVKMWRAV